MESIARRRVAVRPHGAATAPSARAAQTSPATQDRPRAGATRREAGARSAAQEQGSAHATGTAPRRPSHDGVVSVDEPSARPKGGV